MSCSEDALCCVHYQTQHSATVHSSPADLPYPVRHHRRRFGDIQREKETHQSIRHSLSILLEVHVVIVVASGSVHSHFWVEREQETLTATCMREINRERILSLFYYSTLRKAHL